MDPIAETVGLFENGLNCAQAVITVFGKQFGVDAMTARKLGRPWGGGMGHQAKTCGALTGAIVVLGLMNTATDEGEAREAAFAAVQKLFNGFKEKYGTTVCKNLLGADMSTPEGRQKIGEKGLVTQFCPGFVRTVSEILDEMINSTHNTTHNTNYNTNHRTPAEK